MECPFISDAPQYEDGSVKASHLVWQSKKCQQLDFIILFYSGRNSKGKWLLPRLEKWYFPVADEDIAEGETSGD